LKAQFGKCIKLTITKEMIYNLDEVSGFSHLLSVNVNVCKTSVESGLIGVIGGKKIGFTYHIEEKMIIFHEKGLFSTTII
jgi:hypothetical protein